ncbi:DinB family protein [Pedobacter hiemivivus]|uniref:DinB family protein n=1 Tax=Pedobacter hiemivivus TaxID=2530454 RepID=A0A4R0NFC7_9SPHI|nr:DinB family protein [Pedobacter hiemivivus]TCC98437.1 DinB family protein [Pedobacter hiemivivus]
MEYLLNITRQTRENFIKLIETSTVEELNEIPAGFNNNIIWNFGHIVASQQGLCYRLANVEPVIEKQYILPYTKGTKPEKFIDAEEINSLKEMMRNTINQLEEDLNGNKFMTYNSFKTAYGVEIKSSTEAVQFFVVHDALHYGIASAIKKVINTNK